ncbi:YdcF family protein [Halofilum ochraceum]|uniref:YdcF family protein n=1 Tax=Halofilum ochraceum TaxID=1611323 RepID=UPI0008D96E1B|nr:YdcF family protein [Halofilum ochraceum]
MLQHLAHPLTLTLALLALAIVLLFFRRRWTAIFLLLIALVGTWLLATPFVAQKLMYSLERQYKPTAIDRIPDADAIVVLGGGVSPQAPPRIGPNLGHGADRIWFGAQLYAAGKAPLIITTGMRPYTDQGQTAAAAGAEVLQAFGVPADAIIAPGRSLRTYTDAQIVGEIVEREELGRVLLITSALHMPRAMATFRSAQVRAFPAPTDFEVVESPEAGTHPWLPGSEAFWQTSRALHEYVGMAWYRWKGWIH